jgi:hypothetical protein
MYAFLLCCSTIFNFGKACGIVMSRLLKWNIERKTKFLQLRKVLLVNCFMSKLRHRMSITPMFLNVHFVSWQTGSITVLEFYNNLWGIGLSYWPARLQNRTPWKRFLGSLKV